MATKKKVEPKVEEVVDEPVKPASQSPVVVEPKLVKILPKISGRKFVGNRWYELKKDKEMHVPADVKRVLKEAGAIYL